MRISDFQNIIEVIKQDILQSEDAYLRLLSVVGKNQRYNFINQLSIYDRNKNATACAKFDYWKKELNRVVKRDQKGIPKVLPFQEALQGYRGRRPHSYALQLR